MYKEIEYDKDPFVKNKTSHPWITIGDREVFIKEIDKEFSDVYETFSDKFLTEQVINVEKLGFGTVAVNDLQPKCFEIEGSGPILMGFRLRIARELTPFTLLRLGIDDNSFIENFELIKELAKKLYGHLKPVGMCVELSLECKIDQNMEVWGNTVCGRYIQQINLDHDSLFRLQQSDEIMDFGTYEQRYGKWMNETPAISKYVGTSKQGRLEECAKEGLYFDFFVNEEHAGFICGVERSIFGNKAVYIADVFLFEEYRGKGFAKTMQQMFHLRLDPNYKYIWGDIMGINKPSLNAALSCGRKVIGREICFKF